ncbi:MAG: hypothetical protein ACM31C_20770 [Acidobacteriota bacterium]
MRTALLVACLTGCTGSGSLDLELQLPTVTDLRPSGAATITVIAQSPGTDPMESTAVVDKTGHFTAGDLPVGKDIQIDVLLRDVSSRLVGVGEGPQPITITGDTITTMTIPVRKPFVYAASGTNLYTFDDSLDPRDAKFQGALTGLASPSLAVSVGGELLVIGSGSQLQLVDTSTHMVKGSPIAIPGAVHDIAPVPGKKMVAVGHASGVAIVDLESGTVQNASGPSVDKITVGQGQDGTLQAFGLVGRVRPPAGPLDPCSGSSQMVTVPVDSPPASVQATPLAQATSDLAAAPNAPGLYATEPCAGKVVRLDGELSSDVSLERAALLAVAGGRVWAVGSHAATPVCFDVNFNPEPCPANATESCTSGNYSSGAIGWANPGAQLVVESIPLAGGSPIEIDLPERRETMLDAGDPRDSAHENARDLHPLYLEPLDLVVLPGAQYIGVVTTSTYYTMEFIGPTSGGTAVILPCLSANIGDWLLIDSASTAVAERVRTECDLTYGINDIAGVFQTWECADPPAGEQNTQTPYFPTSVGALFGAR